MPRKVAGSNATTSRHLFMARAYRSPDAVGEAEKYQPDHPFRCVNALLFTIPVAR